MKERVVVTGAGGFIGGHLVKRLLKEGYSVRAVDWKAEYEWDQIHKGAENRYCRDLRSYSDARESCEGMDHVYNLAADMGGMGFIETHKLDCMLSVLINTNMLMASVAQGVSRYFYSSSACVYPGYLQNGTGELYKAYGKNGWYNEKRPNRGLMESDAYPADPEDGYGWEKLFSERMCRHFGEERRLEVRVARYHNVYGPYTTWEGGREKAPAAMCRKVAEATITGSHSIDIWGDGTQLRSYMYIDDCIEGTRRLMDSNWQDPLNIGSSEMVSVNELADLVEDIGGVLRGEYPVMRYQRTYTPDAPRGVDGRNSDNTLIKKVLRWEPEERLAAGLIPTYNWIYGQVEAKLAAC